ncbi:hypothetical protein RAC89_28105 [Paenibacillus sp. GD4]|uniref:hypothetical protein n=1 Tax=Paenibacillus sp. GD4 TaxID=3068890 RepID=UPI002796CE2E|nr:hypothetical protein [Paenibacillus sp. GD4]MDQ1914266.1 hypothetical protein [Paenibacillus sp. GD4]
MSVQSREQRSSSKNESLSKRSLPHRAAVTLGSFSRYWPECRAPERHRFAPVASVPVVLGSEAVAKQFAGRAQGADRCL